MKILIIGSTGKDSLESNLRDAFNDITDARIDLLEWPPKMHFRAFKQLSRVVNYLIRTTKLISVFNRSFLRKARLSHSDLVIVFTGASRFLDPAIVTELKRFSKGVFCWYVDASVNLTENLLYSEYDHIYLIDDGLRNYLEPILRTKSSSLLLEGFNSRHHRPTNNVLRNEKIAVVGSLYPERILFLEYLVKHGFELQIFGFGLPRGYGNGPLRQFDSVRFLTLEEKSKVFQEAKCVLNTFHPAHLNAINCRVFEAMASGALLVSQRSALLSDTFKDSEELLMFDGFDDAVKLLRALYNSEFDEDLIRLNALRAVSEHSLLNRARGILDDFSILLESKSY